MLPETSTKLATKTARPDEARNAARTPSPLHRQTAGRLPDWSHLVQAHDESWTWQERKLIHREYHRVQPTSKRTGVLQRLLVNHVYSRQNKSRSVRDTIQLLLNDLTKDAWGLNLGSGDTKYHSRLINLDIQDQEHVDILSSGTGLPFRDDSLDLVVSQEVLEHVNEPLATIAEVLRVLRPGGKFYCQVPFIIGFHPGPYDYWRFTRQALEHLFQNEQWTLETLDQSLGHGSGFYRVLVEFLAVTSSTFSQRLYRPTKALAAVLFMPLQWFDLLTPLSTERDRIPGGYFCVAVKR